MFLDNIEYGKNSMFSAMQMEQSDYLVNNNQEN